MSIEQSQTEIIFAAKFQCGAVIYADGRKVYTITPCTYHDDDLERLVLFDGTYYIQRQCWDQTATRTWRVKDKWENIKHFTTSDVEVKTYTVTTKGGVC